MEITDIRVTLRSEDKLKGFANITLDNQFVIRGLKIIAGTNGFFVSMPSRKRPDGSHQDIAHPVNSEARKMVEELVLTAYEETVKNSSGRNVLGHNVSEQGGSDKNNGDSPASSDSSPEQQL